MSNEKNESPGIWGKILKITITVLSAIAAAFGIQACGFGL